MKRCPACGREADDDSARFCASCGAALDQPAPASGPARAEVPPESPPEDRLDHAETVPRDDRAVRNGYRQAVREALADGVLDQQDRKSLESLREKACLSTEETARIEEETRADYTRGPEPAAGPLPDEGLPVVLQINDNHFYMENCAGVLDFQLRSRVGDVLRNICLSVRGSYFGSDEKCFAVLRPDQTEGYKIQIEPTRAGEHLVQVVLAYEADGQVHVCTAQPSLMVLARDATPANLKIAIDQSVHAETGSKLGFGLSIRNDVDNAFLRGLIQNVNDLIGQSFPDRWAPVRLSLDEEMTRRYREKAPRRVRPVPGLAPAPPPLAKAAVLFGDPPGSRRLLLAGLPAVHMGRSRANDVVLRVLPRSAANDHLSLQITGSRHHCVLSLRREGLFLADGQTVNHTYLNDEEVKGEAAVPLDQPSEIDVARAIRLHLMPLLEPAAPAGVTEETYADLGAADDLWRIAEQRRLCSIVIRRIGNLASEEAYLLVYRWADLAAGPSHELLPVAEGLADARARLVRRGGRFWIENLVEGGAVSVAGMSVPRGQACPLAPGVKLVIGDVSATFGDFRQVGL